MDWNILWLPLGGLAFLLAFIALFRGSMGKREGWQGLVFGSLTCGLLCVLSEYRMAAVWILHGDLAAVEDVVPPMSRILTGAVLLGLGLDLLVFLLCTRGKPGEAQRTQGKER